MLKQLSTMTLSGANLEFRNATNALKAFFDSSGNFNISGLLVENYGNP